MHVTKYCYLISLFAHELLMSLRKLFNNCSGKLSCVLYIYLFTLLTLNCMVKQLSFKAFTYENQQ